MFYKNLSFDYDNERKLISVILSFSLTVFESRDKIVIVMEHASGWGAVRLHQRR